MKTTVTPKIIKQNSIFGVTVVLYYIKILSGSRSSRSHFVSGLFLATSNVPSNSQPASVDNSTAVSLPSLFFIFSPPYFKFRIFLGRPSEYHRVT